MYHILNSRFRVQWECWPLIERGCPTAGRKNLKGRPQTPEAGLRYPLLKNAVL